MRRGCALALLTCGCLVAMASNAAAAAPPVNALLTTPLTVLYPVAGGGETTAIGFRFDFANGPADGAVWAFDQNGRILWSGRTPGCGGAFGGFDFDQDGWPDLGLAQAVAGSEVCPPGSRKGRSSLILFSGRTGQIVNPFGLTADYPYPAPSTASSYVHRWSGLGVLFGPGPTLAFAPAYAKRAHFGLFTGGGWATRPFALPILRGATRGDLSRSQPLNGLVAEVGGETRLVAWGLQRVSQYRAAGPRPKRFHPSGEARYISGRRSPDNRACGGTPCIAGRNYGQVSRDPASSNFNLISGADGFTLFADLQVARVVGPEALLVPSGPAKGLLRGRDLNVAFADYERHVSIYSTARPGRVDDRFFSAVTAATRSEKRRARTWFTRRTAYPANPIVLTGGGPSRIAYNVFSEPEHGAARRWSLHVSEPGSTRDAARISDEYLWDIRDVDGDGADEWITSPTDGYLPRMETRIYRWDEARRGLELERTIGGAVPYLFPSFRAPEVSTTRGALYPVLTSKTPEGLKLIVTRDARTPQIEP